MTETMDAALHEVQGVPSGLVPQVWPGVVSLVERAVARGGGDRTSDDYLAECRCALAQLWLVSRGGKLRGVVITEVRTFPRHRVAVIELLAGDGWDEWADPLLAAIEDWARGNGCASIRSSGRPGFSKAAARSGLRVAGTILEKVLIDA